MPASDPRSAETLELVQEGWLNIHLQRPLAAWAGWQRALRLSPKNAAATQALDRLANAAELPAAARAEYRFQTPSDPDRRARWDAILNSSGGLDDLSNALDAFTLLVHQDPTDAAAHLNRAFCLAWLARNLEAIQALDQAVHLTAEQDPNLAAGAWTLAEVLRLGAGAEALADDLRHAWVVESREPADLDHWIESLPCLVPVVPPALVAEEDSRSDCRVFEWLDRPPTADPQRAEDLPRVLAAVIASPRFIRLSSPDPTGFVHLERPELLEARRNLAHPRLEMTPLWLSQADAALGTFKFPLGLDPVASANLSRSIVEHYYENLWIHVPRHSLNEKAPIESARLALAGDAVQAAKLRGLVRFREQYGERPGSARAYQGYPFDRLRRRLGFFEGQKPPPTVEADDPSCMSEPELDRLVPEALDDARLVECVESALHFRDDPRIAKFVAALLGRDSLKAFPLDWPATLAPLARVSLAESGPGLALQQIDRAIELSGQPEIRPLLLSWKAEILVRESRAEEALAIYQGLLLEGKPGQDSSQAADLAINGAEFLIGHGHESEALALIGMVQDWARASGEPSILDRLDALRRLLG